MKETPPRTSVHLRRSGYYAPVGELGAGRGPLYPKHQVAGEQEGGWALQLLWPYQSEGWKPSRVWLSYPQLGQTWVVYTGAQAVCASRNERDQLANSWWAGMRHRRMAPVKSLNQKAPKPASYRCISGPTG